MRFTDCKLYLSNGWCQCPKHSQKNILLTLYFAANFPLQRNEYRFTVGYGGKNIR